MLLLKKSRYTELHSKYNMVNLFLGFSAIANVLERPRAKFLNEHAFGSFKNAGDWILKDVRYMLVIV